MSRLFRWTLIISSVIGVPVVLYSVGIYAFLTPVGVGVGLLFLPVYTTVALLLLRLSPMWPRAGWLWVAACLVWGGGFSLLLLMLSGFHIIELMDKLGWDLVTASFGGAWPEEIAKAAGVAIILLTFRQLNRPWHGLITGAVVGLGFEVVENAGYGALGALMDPNSDAEGAFFLWLYRIAAGPGLHIAFTALAGWGLGLALFRAGRSTAWRWGVAGFWLFMAFILHFGWNLMWEEEWQIITTMVIVALILYPLLIVVWIRAHRECRADQTYVFTPVPLTSVRQVVPAVAAAGPDTAVGPGARQPVRPGRERGAARGTPTGGDDLPPAGESRP